MLCMCVHVCVVCVMCVCTHIHKLCMHVHVCCACVCNTTHTHVQQAIWCVQLCASSLNCPKGILFLTVSPASQLVVLNFYSELHLTAKSCSCMPSGLLGTGAYLVCLTRALYMKKEEVMECFQVRQLAIAGYLHLPSSLYICNINTAMLQLGRWIH